MKKLSYFERPLESTALYKSNIAPGPPSSWNWRFENKDYVETIIYSKWDYFMFYWRCKRN